MPAFQLQKIDESLIQEHCELSNKDHCYFFGDYAGRKGYNHSRMNNLINNLKKPMDRKDNPEWHYKKSAIADVVNLLHHTPQWPKLKTCMWVPTPSSKLKTNELYDDRLMDILLKLQVLEKSLDIRELLSIKNGREEAHIAGSKRFSVQEHIDNMILDDAKIHPAPAAIIIFDDVITTGSTFKAAQSILQKKYTGVPIVGVFIARSIQQY